MQTLYTTIYYHWKEVDNFYKKLFFFKKKNYVDKRLLISVYRLMVHWFVCNYFINIQEKLCNQVCKFKMCAFCVSRYYSNCLVRKYGTLYNMIKFLFKTLN